MTGLMELPTFLLIGAAKSGTTALFDILTQHPQVYRPFIKEPKFFNNDENYGKGIEWYTGTFFNKAKKYPVRGEATPHYLYWGEKTASRIRQIPGLEQIKFVAIFRDPVKRAYSQYWMDVQREIETLSFEEALEEEPKRLLENQQELESKGLLKYGYFHGGCYATLLQPYLDQFPREQFFFLLQDDLRQDFTDTLDRLGVFLGLPPGYGFQQLVSNPAYKPRNSRMHHFFLFPSGPVYKMIRSVLRLLPLSQRFKLRQRAVQANLKATSYPPMGKVVEEKMRNRYEDEVKKLEVILGRNLHYWLVTESGKEKNPIP
jgi:hypothetical protein